MIKTFNGKTPKIAASAFVSQTAVIVGDVEIGENCGIFMGTVIRGDFDYIKIGKNTNIEDNCVIHGTGLDIGENVVIGHCAMVQCKKIGRNTVIGIQSTILDDAEVGANCVIAAGAVVRPGAKIPDGSFVTGIPAEVRGPLSDKQKEIQPHHYLVYTTEFKRKCKKAGL